MVSGWSEREVCPGGAARKQTRWPTCVRERVACCVCARVFTHDPRRVFFLFFFFLPLTHSLFAAQFTGTHLYSRCDAKGIKRKKKDKKQSYFSALTTTTEKYSKPFFIFFIFYFLQSSLSFVLQTVARRGHCLTTFSVRADD